MQSDILFIILLLKAVSNLPFLQYLFTDLVDKGFVGLPAGSQGWNRIMKLRNDRKGPMRWSKALRRRSTG